MAHKNPELTRETTITTSTGAYALAGVVSGFVTFASQLADGDTVWCAIRMAPDYEEGLYTYASAGNTLARTQIFFSSNSNNAVSWGAGVKDIYATTPTTVMMTSHAATIASAGTTELGSSKAPVIDVSGTTTITSFGSTAPTGTLKFLRFQGALTLTQNATSLILPGAANIVTVAGETAAFKHEGSGNWRCLFYDGSGAWAQFTPVITAASGTFTSVAGNIYWKRTGRTVAFRGRINITTNGTAAGAVVATLPIAANTTNAQAQLVGRENAVSGKMVSGTITSSLAIVDYTGAYPGASGAQLEFSGVYEAA